MMMLREWEINPREKKSGIQLGFEPKTFWILVRHTHHWTTWMDSARGAEDLLHKQDCLQASAEFQLILTLSELNKTGTLAELCNL